MVGPTRLTRRRATVPVFSLVAEPGVPPVFVMDIDGRAIAGVEQTAHAHDFPGLVYFQGSGGALRFGDKRWLVRSGDAYLIAPGAVVGIEDADALARAGGRSVFFTPAALSGLGLTGDAHPGPLAWRAHPLLAGFVDQASSSVVRLEVPARDRSAWAAEIDAIERELRERAPGYDLATLAHLTMLLVAATRLADDTAVHLRANQESLLADVFGVIERRYTEPLSLRDVARQLHLTAGHLTTVVRRKTGRTVQEWILERRMAEARRLLAGTDLTVAEVGQRVGYRDPGYFGRAFNRLHGTTPRAWRQRVSAGATALPK